MPFILHLLLIPGPGGAGPESQSVKALSWKAASSIGQRSQEPREAREAREAREQVWFPLHSLDLWLRFLASGPIR